MLMSVLNMLLDEVKEFKLVTRQLQQEQRMVIKDIAMLKAKQLEQERYQNQVHIKINRMEEKLISSVMLSGRAHELQMRRQVLRCVPFLADYPTLADLSVPFAVRDAAAPFLAFMKIMPDPYELTVPPPIVVYINDAFCKLIGYSVVCALPPSLF